MHGPEGSWDQVKECDPAPRRHQGCTRDASRDDFREIFIRDSFDFHGNFIRLSLYFHGRQRQLCVSVRFGIIWVLGEQFWTWFATKVIE